EHFFSCGLPSSVDSWNPFLSLGAGVDPHAADDHLGCIFNYVMTRSRASSHIFSERSDSSAHFMRSRLSYSTPTLYLLRMRLPLPADLLRFSVATFASGPSGFGSHNFRTSSPNVMRGPRLRLS